MRVTQLPSPPDQQRAADEGDLQRLVVFHKVLLFILALFVGLIVLGIATAPVSTSSHFRVVVVPSPGQMLLFLLLLVNIVAIRWLSRRKSLNWLYAASALNLLQFPIGLVLGVYSLVTLSRPGIREVFVVDEEDDWQTP